jgi:hypothetical protein
VPRPISTWSNTEKIAEVLRRSKAYLPAAMGAQVDALISPANLAITAGTIVVWAGSHFFGVGEVVDVGLLLVGAFFVGWSMKDVVSNLITFGIKTIGARSDQDLDEAARAFANAVIIGGITAVMAILLRRSAKQIQATRGTSPLQAARPRSPGLGNIGPDSQAGAQWRRPTVTADPAAPAGTGSTTWFGDVSYSTAGSATAQELARLHELGHSFLRPRLSPLRTFRARLAASAYWRSAIMQYLEESLVETFAQLRVHGLSGLMTGIRFPIANGYMSLQVLLCEGAEIGTISLGAQRFSVQFLPGPPALASESTSP